VGVSEGGRQPAEGGNGGELALADGSKTKLSDYRDKIVWLYIWRAG
jgi:hypothetical protein